MRALYDEQVDLCDPAEKSRRIGEIIIESFIERITERSVET